MAPTLPRRARGRPAGASLASSFDPRANALTVLRLALALTVAGVHSGAVAYGRQPTIGSTQVGALAVDAFFVISGFLVTGSLLRLPSLSRYLWHRALRILPGFWTCLMVTAVAVVPVVALLEGRSVARVLFEGEDSALRYVSDNFALLMTQFGAHGLPTATAEPGVLDGSLWTLFYEAVCYVGLGVAGAVFLRRGVRWPMPVTAAALWALTIAQSAGAVEVGQDRLLRFGLLFVTASAAALYSQVVPVHRALAALSALLVGAGLLLLPDYRALAAPAFVYLVLYAAVRLPLRHDLATDLSYGVYVYHWPVYVLGVQIGLAAWGWPAFAAVCLALTLASAALSWHLVERPALALKAWVPRGLGGQGRRLSGVACSGSSTRSNQPHRGSPGGRSKVET